MTQAEIWLAAGLCPVCGHLPCAHTATGCSQRNCPCGREDFRFFVEDLVHREGCGHWPLILRSREELATQVERLRGYVEVALNTLRDDSRTWRDRATTASAVLEELLQTTK